MSILGDRVWRENEKLTAMLIEAASGPEELDIDLDEEGDLHESFLRDADAVVTHTEVNDRHGVGVLLRRLFRDRNNVLTVRSSDHYDGQQDFEGVGMALQVVPERKGKQHVGDPFGVPDQGRHRMDGQHHRNRRKTDPGQKKPAGHRLDDRCVVGTRGLEEEKAGKGYFEPAYKNLRHRNREKNLGEGGKTQQHNQDEHQEKLPSLRYQTG